MSCVMKMTPESKSRLMSLMSRRICACTVTSSAVVGSSQMSTAGLLHSAIAMTMRWRIPPESSPGIERKIFSGIGMPTCSIRRSARRSASALLTRLCARIVSEIWRPQVISGLRLVIGS